MPDTLRQDVAASSTFAWNFPQSSGAAVNPIECQSMPRAQTHAGFAAGSGPMIYPAVKMPFSGSLSVPVTRENRNYLRMLRRMELRAWREAKGAHDASLGYARELPQTARSRISPVEHERDWHRKALAAAAAVLIGYLILKSEQLLEVWPGFFQAITQFLD